MTSPRTILLAIFGVALVCSAGSPTSSSAQGPTFAEALRGSEFRPERLKALRQSGTLQAKTVVDSLLALRGPLRGAFSVSSDFVVVADGRAGLHAIDLLAGAPPYRLQTLIAPLDDAAYDLLLKDHWGVNDYVMSGWDPPFTKHRAALMGLEMTDTGSIRETRPARIDLWSTGASSGGPNCVLRSWRNGRVADVSSICRINGKLRFAKIVAGNLAYISVSPGGDFFSVVDTKTVRLFRPDGSLEIDGAAYPNESLIAWLDHRSFLVYGPNAARMFDPIAKKAWEPTGCDGKGGVRIGAVIPSKSAAPQVIDGNGREIVWVATRGQFECR